MSIWSHWLSHALDPLRRRRSLRPSLPRSKRRRGFESLESRRVLSVNSNFLAGTLTINLTGADTVALTAAGGNVQLTINGLPGFDPDSGVLFAGDVNEIDITGVGNFDNTIDLTALNKSDFGAQHDSPQWRRRQRHLQARPKHSSRRHDQRKRHRADRHRQPSARHDIVRSGNDQPLVAECRPLRRPNCWLHRNRIAQHRWHGRSRHDQRRLHRRRNSDYDQRRRGPRYLRQHRSHLNRRRRPDDQHRRRRRIPHRQHDHCWNRYDQRRASPTQRQRRDHVQWAVEPDRQWHGQHRHI